jgi:hypothetical protein
MPHLMSWRGDSPSPPTDAYEVISPTSHPPILEHTAQAYSSTTITVLHPVNIQATSCEWLYHTKVPIKWMKHQLLNMQTVHLQNVVLCQDPIEWIKHWLLNMHTIHLQNVAKCQVPIGLIKHWLLNMQTGHLQNVCSHPSSFQFPHPILATPVP